MGGQKGFTITELMVVLAIVAILLSIGVPSYRYITNSYRLSAEVNSLLGDLQYARAEAIRQGQWVTVCVSNDGQTCSGTNTWQSGWIVWPNPAGPPNAVPAAGSVLRVQGAFTGNPPDAFLSDQGVTQVNFNREGFVTTPAGFPNTTVTLHDPTSTAAWTRCLWITPVGLLTTETPANNPSGTCI